MSAHLFITTIYNQMREANIVSSTEDFSKRYLKKSSKYYSVIKAQGRDANTEVLLDCLEQLAAIREYFQAKYPNTLMEQRYEKWVDIENQLAEEIAQRTTKRATIANPALKSVIQALHTISSQRNGFTVQNHAA